MLSPELSKFIEEVTVRLHDDHHPDDDRGKSLMMHLTKAQEELGELAHEVGWLCGIQRKRDYRDGNYNKKALAKECVDVIFAVLVLAQSAWVDTNQALQERMETIKKRFNMS